MLIIFIFLFKEQLSPVQNAEEIEILMQGKYISEPNKKIKDYKINNNNKIQVHKKNNDQDFEIQEEPSNNTINLQ